MHLDYFTLAALADFLRPRLIGARLQRVIAVDEWAIGLELYGQRERHQLYLSADNQNPRIQLMPGPLRRGRPQPQPLALYLRSHLLGARLTQIEQPAWERILHFHFTTFTTAARYTLISEPFPRRANLILTEAGQIRECLRRVGPEINRHRAVLPGQPYLPPPPQLGKRPPWPLQEEDWLALRTNFGNAPIARALTGHFLAISPLLAREICHRAAIPPKTPARDCDYDALTHGFAALLPALLAGEWQPGCARDPATQRALAYSPYPARQYPDWQPCADMNAALAQFYGVAVGAAAYAAAKRPLRAAIEKARTTLQRRRVNLERNLQDEDSIRRLQQSGELILAYQYQLQPGQTQLRAQYDPEEPALTIALNPQQTALENAQSYFQRYRKAQRALTDGPKRLNELRREELALEQLATDLLLAENWPEIDEVAAGLREAGHLRNIDKNKKRPTAPRSSGPQRLVWDGYVLLYGRNGVQNAALLRRGQPSDLWLHARGVAGGHVLIRDDGRAIPEQLIEKAARLAAHLSKAQEENEVAVDIAERRHVRPIKGAAPGLVRYSHARTLLVTPGNIGEWE